MLPSPLKRNGAPLTENEKLMIININNYFSGANSIENDHKTLTLRKRVAEVLGVAERTVGMWYQTGTGVMTVHLHHKKFLGDLNFNLMKILQNFYAFSSEL